MAAVYVFPRMVLGVLCAVLLEEGPGIILALPCGILCCPCLSCYLVAEGYLAEGIEDCKQFFEDQEICEICDVDPRPYNEAP